MPKSLPQHSRSGWRSIPHKLSASPHWTIATLSVPSAALALALVLPSPLILPALSFVMLAAGFGLALFNYCTASRGCGTSRDLAGALVFFGFAASLMADPEQVLQAFAEFDAALGGGRPTAE
jgi:hypothetical protein